MKRKSDKLSTVLWVIMLFVGLSVMLYPSFSNWWNKRVQSRVVAGYQQAVAMMDTKQLDRIMEEARKYNTKLKDVTSPFSAGSKLPGYYSVLDITGTGIIGYISIPCINVELPIYHGTSAEVLNIAAGHLEGSSFPIDGTDVHAVISAHRGLPAAKLFTDLDKLVVGDIFTITILNEVYSYEVEKQLIVEPYEMDKLEIIPDKNYVTLVTCTPYGVNTQRMLIRSHQIETVYERTVKVEPDALKVDPMLVIPVIASPPVLILIMFWIFGGGKSYRKRTYKEYADILTNKGG